jgi:hypothetical protein
MQGNHEEDDAFFFFILKTRKAASSLLQLYAHLVHVDQKLPGTAQNHDTA